MISISTQARERGEGRASTPWRPAGGCGCTPCCRECVPRPYRWLSWHIRWFFYTCITQPGTTRESKVAWLDTHHLKVWQAAAAMTPKPQMIKYHEAPTVWYLKGPQTNK